MHFDDSSRNERKTRTTTRNTGMVNQYLSEEKKKKS